MLLCSFYDRDTSNEVSSQLPSPFREWEGTFVSYFVIITDFKIFINNLQTVFTSLDTGVSYVLQNESYSAGYFPPGHRRLSRGPITGVRSHVSKRREGEGGAQSVLKEVYWILVERKDVKLNLPAVSRYSRSTDPPAKQLDPSIRTATERLRTANSSRVVSSS